MGLLDNLRESYQTKLNQRRIERDLPPLKFGDRKLTAWEKEKDGIKTKEGFVTYIDEVLNQL